MSPSASIRALPVGFVLNGRYEVVQPLGQGANGAVYKVRDHHTDQISALKILDPAHIVMTDVWREAQVLARLEGEYILPVRNADHFSGVPYVVTEVAKYGSVGSQVVVGVGVPPHLAVRWVRHACRGVIRLHDRGLVHNDLKPENLFLTAEKEAIVGDLGLACLMDSSGHAAFGGTPATMAPEVAAVGILDRAEWSSNRPASVRSDVYSLGATLYWLLAGIPPYAESGGAFETMSSAAAREPKDLADLAPHVPSGIRNVVKKAMRRNVSDRFRTPAELDAALGRQNLGQRKWVRIEPHSGHSDCYEGHKGSSHMLVCAVPVPSRPGYYQVQAKHASSRRRAHQPWGIGNSRQLPSVLRATFRACG